MSCSPEPKGFIGSSFSIQDYEGAYLVTSSIGKSVILFDSNWNYLRTLLLADRFSTDLPYGTAVNREGEVFITSGAANRVIKTNLDGSEFAGDFITTSIITGNMRGITQLTDGDLLFIRTSTVERFTSEGIRVLGLWPRVNLMNTMTDIRALPDGGFIACSTNTDALRAYDSNGVQTATVSSGIAGTTDVANCDVGPNGEVAAAFNGTTDTIRVYSDSSFSQVLYSFSNLAITANPRALAFKPNGNLVIIDGTNHLIIEIRHDGSGGGEVVTTLSNPFIQNAVSLTVVK